MKKAIIFLGIIIVLFGALAFVTNYSNSEKAEGNPYGKDTLDPATIDQLDDPLYQNQILPDELDKKLSNEDDVFVYFYSPTCIHCKNTSPILVPLAEDMDIDLKKYNVLEFEQGWNDYQIESTPTLVRFKDGKEVDRIVGTQTEETFKQWIEQNK
ncbi:thioredoxin family protein [Pseudalkalibacillus hwajinpoensis]|uniref:thioredoxin family protein n=1 Tax=Guptibacillus hwajinpoensis TaxID=208199 RepID=UPI001CD3ADA5|nr:thioredoxin family protein [Pseudalkalibacillus hwajinpoensis]MCA0993544.1 thioredoxin family protein [Pseudalkalibacillus hwajinpoensis]